MNHDRSVTRASMHRVFGRFNEARWAASEPRDASRGIDDWQSSKSTLNCLDPDIALNIAFSSWWR